MPTNINWPSISVIRKTTSEGGTTSEVYARKGNDSIKLYGIEPPWRDNKPFVSCIPSGQYVILPWESSKYGDCFAFTGGEVSLYKGSGAARYACLIHPANYAHQLQGCLAVGLSKGETTEGNPAVWSSRKAMSKLIDLVGDGRCIAYIRWID